MKRFLLVALLLCTLSGYANAAILVMSPNGKYTTKATLAIAATAADTIGKTIVVTSPQVVTTAIVWPSDRAIEFKRGGYVTFSGAGALTGLTEARPEWFGGSDSLSLQRAIDALGVSGGVLSLYPNKTYILDREIHFDGNILSVMANNAEFKKAVAVSSVDTTYSSIAAMLHIVNNAKVSFFDLRVNGNKANNTNEIAFIRLEGALSPMFSRCTFRDEAYHVFYIRDNVQGLVVQNSSFLDNYGALTGSDVYSSGEGSYGVFFNNNFTRSATAWTDLNGLTQAFYMPHGEWDYLYNNGSNYGSFYDFSHGIHRVTGGNISSAHMLLNMTERNALSGATVSITGVTATGLTGIPGTTTCGVHLAIGSLTMRDVSLSGSGAAYNYGVWGRTVGGYNPDKCNLFNVTSAGAITAGFRFDDTASRNNVDSCTIKDSPIGIITLNNTGETFLLNNQFVNVITLYSNLDGTQRGLSYPLLQTPLVTFGVTTIDTSADTINMTPNGDATFVTSGLLQSDGTSKTFCIKTTGTSFVMTWHNAYFKPSATLITGTVPDKLFYVTFKYNLSVARWVEVYRTIAM